MSDAFEEVALLPGCIGAIDDTHMEMKPPADDINSYLNRLRYYSMVLQAVCDQEMRFTSCSAGFQARRMTYGCIGFPVLHTKLPITYSFLVSPTLRR